MKLLIITEGFFPGKKYGGPPVSVNNLCSLMNDYDCRVVARNHDLGESEPYADIHEGWNDRGNCKVCYLSDSDYSQGQLTSIVKDLQPDILYLQSMFSRSTIPALTIARKFDIPVLLAPRGELCAGAMKKKYKKIPYLLYLRAFRLTKNVAFQYTSSDELNGIRKYLGHSVKCYSLPNVASRPLEPFCHQPKKPQSAHFAFISRIVPKKNLRYAIELFKNIIGNVSFDVYGPAEDGKYFEICQDAWKKLPMNVTVAYKGAVKQEEVAKIFSHYDGFIFPTHSENYGHVIAEALSAGCPVLVSDQTPWTFENHEAAGSAIPLSDEASWTDAIQRIVDADDNEMIQMRKDAVDYFISAASFDEAKSSYSGAFQSLIEDRS